MSQSISGAARRPSASMLRSNFRPQSGDNFTFQLALPMDVSLEDDVLVLYKVSDYYAPAQESGIRWDDPDIAIPWPFKDTDIIISEKDRRLPLLSEFASPLTITGVRSSV